MSLKSNEEIAREVITDWHDYEKWHDPSMMPIPPFSGAQEGELSRLITSALATAQSEARVKAFNDIVDAIMLSEVGNEVATICAMADEENIKLRPDFASGRTYSVSFAREQSELARAVLSEIENVETPSMMTTATKQVVEQRLRDLFTAAGLNSNLLKQRSALKHPR